MFLSMTQTTTVRILNFVGKIFVFGCQENFWGINFRGHGGVVGTIIVEYAIGINFRGV